MRENLSPIKSESPDGQLEIDRAVELRALANMLRRSQGFTLAFAQCNQPSERRKLVSELRLLLGDLSRILCKLKFGSVVVRIHF